MTQASLWAACLPECKEASMQCACDMYLHLSHTGLDARTFAHFLQEMENEDTEYKTKSSEGKCYLVGSCIYFVYMLQSANTRVHVWWT